MHFMLALETVNPCYAMGIEPGSWLWYLMGCPLIPYGVRVAVPVATSMIAALFAAVWVRR